MQESKPTVSEFVPAAEIEPNRTGKPMLKTLQATDDGGLEIAAHEPYDDVVHNHVYICDECGNEEDTENAIAHHVEHTHL